MNLTHYLLLIIVVLLLQIAYPEQIKSLRVWVFGALVIYGLYWLIAIAPARLKERRARLQQEKSDEDEYWEYKAKSDAIRTKYDPNDEWNEITSVPDEYRKEVRALNLEHANMLIRRNGWTGDDFDD